MADTKNFSIPKMNIGAFSTGKSSASSNKSVVAEAGAEEVKKTSFNIPIDIYRSLRKLAATEDRRVGDIVEEALQDVLRKHGV